MRNFEPWFSYDTSNQIKSIFVYLMLKVPRLSQTQRWFTENYSVDNVTQADIRN